MKELSNSGRKFWRSRVYYVSNKSDPETLTSNIEKLNKTMFDSG